MKKENDEVQSRRDFFKKAAKTALPILGVAVLASNTVVVKATEILGESSCTCSYGCGNDCMGSCSATCYSTCMGTCASACKGSCKLACANDCIGSCKATCHVSCVGSCSGLLR